MTALNKAPARLNSIIQGQYLLTYVTERRTCSDELFAMIKLEDSTGEIDTYVWAESGLLDDLPHATPVPVHAALYVRRLSGRVIADLRALHSITEPEIKNAARLLPRSDCPERAHSALDSLDAIVRGLEPEPLRRFVNKVLLDPRISHSILTCRGSRKHHHAEPGGLLVHSIEVVRLCESIAAERLSKLECQLTKAAALMHDIGKLRTVGSNNVRPIHYKLVEHGMQTNRMLDDYLEWLRGRAPDLAAGLNYMLSYIAQPNADRHRAHFVGADIVIYADRISAALGNDKRLASLLRQTLPKRQLAAPPVIEHQALLNEPQSLSVH